VILLTMMAELSALVEGPESGADDFIAKPWRLPELYARLRAGQRVIDLRFSSRPPIARFTGRKTPGAIRSSATARKMPLCRPKASAPQRENSTEAARSIAA